MTRARRSRNSAELPDMQHPRRRRRAAASAPGQYVRLRIRVHDGVLSVVEAHLVDGPLGQVTSFPGGNAYEVTLGDRLLHAGALPDLGVQRSFADPSGRSDQLTHHVAFHDDFEFNARLPADSVAPETIGDIAVRLHRVKGEPRAAALGGDRLGVQFEREMRPVAELHGLPESALPEAIERRGGRTPRP